MRHEATATWPVATVRIQGLCPTKPNHLREPPHCQPDSPSDLGLSPVAVVEELSSDHEVFRGQDLDPNFNVHGQSPELMPDQPGVDGSPVQGGAGVPQLRGIHSQDSGRSGDQIHLLLRSEMSSS